MTTLSDILQSVAIFQGLSGVSDLTINGYNVGLFCSNQARLFAEKAHDFKYSETNVFLSIPDTGANYSAAYIDTNAISTGTSSPDITGTFVLAGTHNNYPFYILSKMGSDYYLAFDGTVWNITAGGFATGTDYWPSTVTGANPTGNYMAQGVYTGSAQIAIGTGAIGIKRVKYVSLPISGSGYEVIEFLTNDQFLSRMRIQTGRQYFNDRKTPDMLGATGLVNPLCYQNGRTLYLAPNNLPFPILSQLNIVQWLPDYTATTDTDFIIQYGADFMVWQTVLEMNKNVKWLTVRQEGSIDEEKVIAMRDAALQTLIGWDLGIEGGTSERPANSPVPATPS